MVTGWPSSRTVTVRSSSSASTSTSLSRRSNRFMLTVPEASTTSVGLDAGDPAHRHEDAVPVRDLDDQAEHAGRLPVGAQHGDGVAHLPELVAVGVEHVDARQPGDEDAVARAHRCSVDVTRAQ